MSEVIVTQNMEIMALENMENFLAGKIQSLVTRGINKLPGAGKKSAARRGREKAGEAGKKVGQAAVEKWKEFFKKRIEPIMKSKAGQIVKWLSDKIGTTEFINAFRPPIDKKHLFKEIMLWTAFPAATGAFATAVLGLPVLSAFVFKSAAWMGIQEAGKRMAKKKEQELKEGKGKGFSMNYEEGAVCFFASDEFKKQMARPEPEKFFYQYKGQDPNDYDEWDDKQKSAAGKISKAGWQIKKSIDKIAIGSDTSQEYDKAISVIEKALSIIKKERNNLPRKFNIG